VSSGRARAPEAATDTHEVVPGDNLWDIAAAHLAQATRRPAHALTDGEIASYWVRLMAANQDLLRSGNPNLIFPGERVICPPVEGGLG
jgi:nucleoid-associated protein YgaU